ncbi:MAG: hypothetical protein ACRBF0_17895 [Calditrichia bacterium]
MLLIAPLESQLTAIILLPLFFIGIESAKVALENLTAQQITSLLIENRSFAGTISWLENRQKQSIIICNTILLTFSTLLAIILFTLLQPLLTTISTGIAIAIAFLLLLLFAIYAMKQLGMSLGLTYPIFSIQFMAITIKLFYLLLYPAIIIHNSFANLFGRSGQKG